MITQDRYYQDCNDHNSAIQKSSMGMKARSLTSFLAGKKKLASWHNRKKEASCYWSHKQGKKPLGDKCNQYLYNAPS